MAADQKAFHEHGPKCCPMLSLKLYNLLLRIPRMGPSIRGPSPYFPVRPLKLSSVLKPPKP